MYTDLIHKMCFVYSSKDVVSNENHKWGKVEKRSSLHTEYMPLAAGFQFFIDIGEHLLYISSDKSSSNSKVIGNN